MLDTETRLGTICWVLWWIFVVLITATLDTWVMVGIFQHPGHTVVGVMGGLAGCALITFLCTLIGWGAVEGLP